MTTSALADGRRYTVLEELEVFCPLGLRFWDAVRDRQVRQGLRVRAWPHVARRPVVEAFRTRSGVYAFQGLPGLLPVERPSPGWPAASPASRDFVVEVTDPRRRFLPAAFRVELPLAERGVFLARPPGSPVLAPPGFYLFPAPTRGHGPEIAAVRGELIDAVTGRPAARALVRVDLPAAPTSVTVADQGGRFAALFPFPPLVGTLVPLSSSPPASPASPPAPPIAVRTWDLSVRVAYEPGRLAALPGSAEPEYREVLRQAAAGVLLDDASPPAAADAWTGTLGFGADVVVRTDGHTQLWIVPGDSSP